MTQLISCPQDPLSACSALERGDILFFKEIPFPFPQSEIDFLLTQKQGASKNRKNIAYKPHLDRVTNHYAPEESSRIELHKILRNYSSRVTSFLSHFLAPYAQYWRHDYASFRPFQEKGRPLRLHARNDLLHVDAFPTRPTKGARILRFFTNINPQEPRHWITSLSFAELLHTFLGQKNFPTVPHPKTHSFPFRILRSLKALFSSAGFNTLSRSSYDAFMLRMHHFLKEHEEFQKNFPKTYWEFPPFSCWAVFTDQVSHAALAGQYALEQTFLIPRSALLCPERAPISLLERIAGATLDDDVLKI